ncbi:uncharacterized protein A4U43_C10F8710 [Asparagus officinalis]|uniref:Uncharacterized protein n=1 Tax=Asparagus officinalis TaxID=4686 RepID=A0A5P1E1Y7_ASPOF|nr:uncharacterized protein A4U43_C10F8710 [Asparagus officinalis]
MKSRAPDSLNVPMSTEDDDDDFQNPSQAVAVAQNLILSSLRNPNFSQPLRPSNGAPPPRKRQKPSVSNGKENRRARRVSKSDSSRVSNVRGLEISKFSKENGLSDETLMQNSRVSHESKEVGDEKCQLLGPIGSGLGLTQSSPSSDICVSSTFELTGPAAIESKERDEVKEDILRSEELKTMENCENVQFDINTHSPLEVVSSLKEERGSSSSMSIESRLLESKAKLCSTDAGDAFSNAELRQKEKDPKSMEYFEGCQDKMCSKIGKASYYSMSVESRLLGSRVKCDSSDAVDSHRDLELGTQLNVLMDLCCEIGEGGSSVSDFSFERNGLYNDTFEMDKDGLVECPLCGANITYLSEEQRQVHTNDCLDKAMTTEVILSLLIFASELI